MTVTHWICNLVENETVAIESCRDPDPTVDVFTKALPQVKHKKHSIEMRLVTGSVRNQLIQSTVTYSQDSRRLECG